MSTRQNLLKVLNNFFRIKVGLSLEVLPNDKFKRKEVRKRCCLP